MNLRFRVTMKLFAHHVYTDWRVWYKLEIKKVSSIRPATSRDKCAELLGRSLASRITQFVIFFCGRVWQIVVITISYSACPRTRRDNQFEDAARMLENITLFRCAGCILWDEERSARESRKSGSKRWGWEMTLILIVRPSPPAHLIIEPVNCQWKAAFNIFIRQKVHCTTLIDY